VLGKPRVYKGSLAASHGIIFHSSCDNAEALSIA
jgi:hypothetical protein